MLELYMQTWLTVTAKEKIKDSTQYRLTQSADCRCYNTLGDAQDLQKPKKLTELDSVPYNGYK